MRVLLDTHVWLWLQASPQRLDAKARELVQDTRNELLLSAASAWEIAIKYALGRLALPEPPPSYVPDRMASSGVGGLAVEAGHALHVATLPALHRDPFDRLLVAQSQLESIPIMTADSAIARYDVAVVSPN
ncbi:MAG: type II toxin-antitoxin system VapC family toxin [Actinomycetota bacterium]|nr:type II toxin-antitoxin system VapC family toxin [Actinomycetota bacterium]